MRAILILAATVVAGAVAGLFAPVIDGVHPLTPLGVGALSGLLLAPLGVWIGHPRPLNRTLAVLLLPALGACIWLGPRSNAALTITIGASFYALAALALAFFVPPLRPADPPLAARCPTCNGTVLDDDQRCPHCAVPLRRKPA